jgi:hypothetical protein
VSWKELGQGQSEKRKSAREKGGEDRKKKLTSLEHGGRKRSEEIEQPMRTL